MDNTRQRDLFPDLAREDDGERKAPALTREASLQAALGTFERHMRDEGFSINTVKAFASDIRLLGRYLGIGTPVGEIGTKNLTDFLHWLTDERGVPCSPKSYARRVTALKVFLVLGLVELDMRCLPIREASSKWWQQRFRPAANGLASKPGGTVLKKGRVMGAAIWAWR